MTTDHVALLAIVALLFPMMYFLLASPGFLLAKFDIPIVTRLFRGLFNIHFNVMSIVGVIAMIAFAASGRAIFAIGVGLVAAVAMWGRTWFMPRIDASISARDAGDAAAIRTLRRLHVGGMALNAAQLGALVAAIPYVMPAL